MDTIRTQLFFCNFICQQDLELPVFNPTIVSPPHLGKITMGAKYPLCFFTHGTTVETSHSASLQYPYPLLELLFNVLGKIVIWRSNHLVRRLLSPDMFKWL